MPRASWQYQGLAEPVIYSTAEVVTLDKWIGIATDLLRRIVLPVAVLATTFGGADPQPRPAGIPDVTVQQPARTRIRPAAAVVVDPLPAANVPTVDKWDSNTSQPLGRRSLSTAAAATTYEALDPYPRPPEVTRWAGVYPDRVPVPARGAPAGWSVTGPLPIVAPAAPAILQPTRVAIAVGANTVELAGGPNTLVITNYVE